MKQKPQCKNLYFMDAHGTFFNPNDEDYALYFNDSTNLYSVDFVKNESENTIQQILYSLNTKNDIVYCSWELTPQAIRLTKQALNRIASALNLGYHHSLKLLNDGSTTKLTYVEPITIGTTTLLKNEYKLFRDSCDNKKIHDIKNSSIDFFLYQNLTLLGFYNMDDLGDSFSFSLNEFGNNFYHYVLNLN
jgi:hypothetical protein